MGNHYYIKIRMGVEMETKSRSKITREPVRLYSKGTFVGFKRGQRTQKENTALIAIQNCKDRKASTFYHGKRVAFIYMQRTPRLASTTRASGVESPLPTDSPASCAPSSSRTCHPAPSAPASELCFTPTSRSEILFDLNDKSRDQLV